MFRNDHDGKPEGALESALNNLDILRDIELVLAPLRPTDGMIEAGRRIAGLTAMQARLVYEAMVRASVPSFAEDDLL